MLKDRGQAPNKVVIHAASHHNYEVLEEKSLPQFHFNHYKWNCLGTEPRSVQLQAGILTTVYFFHPSAEKIMNSLF
jgi:hypothetical protein